MNFPSVICNLIHYAMNVNTCLVMHCDHELNPVREMCGSSLSFVKLGEVGGVEK